MQLILKLPFSDFFKKHIVDNEGRGLIGRMSALEVSRKKIMIGLCGAVKVGLELFIVSFDISIYESITLLYVS